MVYLCFQLLEGQTPCVLLGSPQKLPRSIDRRDVDSVVAQILGTHPVETINQVHSLASLSLALQPELQWQKEKLPIEVAVWQGENSYSRIINCQWKTLSCGKLRCTSKRTVLDSTRKSWTRKYSLLKLVFDEVQLLLGRTPRFIQILLEAGPYCRYYKTLYDLLLPSKLSSKYCSIEAWTVTEMNKLVCWCTYVLEPTQESLAYAWS